MGSSRADYRLCGERGLTACGARTTPFGETIGTLEVGKAADFSLIDYRHIAYPYLDEETPLIDALLQRAKTQGAKTVMCDGEVIYGDGAFCRVDRPAALQALHDQMNRALSDDEAERRRLSKALLPYVRQFYRDYIRPQDAQPSYRQSARI